MPINVPVLAMRNPMAARLWAHYADLPLEPSPNLALMAGGLEDDAGELTLKGWEAAFAIFNDPSSVFLTPFRAAA